MSNLLWKSLAARAERMSAEALVGVGNLSDWQAELPGRRREFVRSLGLDPWPAEAEGVPTVRECGEFQGEGFCARKIAYELLPDCWGSAVIYYPNPLPAEKCPAVLYNCGHTPTGTVAFQAHPILWARRGYVCLILDSIEQNDNPGEHHGFLFGTHHLRLALGYVSSGAEAFNAIRALDVLEKDPAVDALKIGVTGVSGGGAMSFFVAALDERIRAVSTLCGICSPRDALKNRHLGQHCDCMFPLNYFQRDAADIAALIAPRAALFCFGKQDKLYHLDECVSLAERAAKIWNLFSASDRCEILVADCPHGDHPDFDQATQRWFDRHLAGGDRPLLERGGEEFPDAVIGVHQGSPPSPNRLGLLPELMRPRGTVPLPSSLSEWSDIRRTASAKLAEVLPQKVAAKFTADAEWHSEGKRLSTHRGTIEMLDVQLDLHEPETGAHTIILSTATASQMVQHLIPAMAPALERTDTAVALFEPRLSGWNYSVGGQSPFPPGSKFDPEALRAKAMTLVGLSPVGYFYQDIGAAVSYLRGRPGQADQRMILHGKGESAAAALLVALLDESIAGVILEDLPGSFADGSEIIGILTVLDIPQALGLLAPRTAIVVDRGHKNWSWTIRAFNRLGASGQCRLAPDMRSAIATLFV